MRRRLLIVFFALVFPFFTYADVIINEIAWMGTETSTADEWMEIYNSGSQAVNLDGWILESLDGTPSITLSGSIGANGFFLLERTDDETVPAITADLIYTGALSNAGEILVLKNGSGVEVDRVDGSNNWESIGGDNTTKQTAQRTESGWITATGTPRAQNVVSSPSQSSAAPSQTSQSQPAQVGSVSSSASGSVSPPPEPQIKVYAGDDKNVITGAEVRFSGSALGLKDEPLENARFLWNFGDGSYKEGRVVSHIYEFPGNYIAVLEVSSGQYSASDNISVKVSKADLKISEVKPGAAGWLEIQNNAQNKVDVGGLKIKHKEAVFIFPPSTFIAAGSRIVVSQTASGLNLETGGEVGLYYANSWPIDKLFYQGALKEGESFNRNFENNSVYIVKETPGEENSPMSTSDVDIGAGEAFAGGKTSDVSPSTSLGTSKTSDVFELVKKTKTQTPAPAEKTSVIEEDEGEADEIESQPALVAGAKDNKKAGTIWWFLGALAMGIFSAAGFLFYRRKSRDKFQVD